MIGFLRGELIAKGAPVLLLDVSGVGYEIEAPMSTFYDLPETGKSITLYTHLVVREDAHSLFGFSTLAQRELFRALIKVNGVGAKMALTLLSGLSVDDFHRCIHDTDSAALVRLPGVGKKTAERLIIEMRDRLPSHSGNSKAGEFGGSAEPTANPRQVAVSALVSLGYKGQEADRMIKNINTDGKNSEDIIRLALQSTRQST